MFLLSFILFILIFILFIYFIILFRQLFIFLGFMRIIIFVLVHSFVRIIDFMCEVCYNHDESSHFP